MKSFLPLLSLAVLASCTTAYKSAQTPDDVYFSPERAREEYVRMEKNDGRRYRNTDDYSDDSYVRMKVRNRLYSVLDDEWYSYEQYSRYNNRYISYSSPWNYASYWNACYNPYGKAYAVVDYKPGVYSKPRTYNLFVFDKDQNNNNPNLPKGSRGSSATYRDNTENYRGTGSNAGNFLRDAFSSGNINVRSGSSESNTSSSSSSSSGNTSSGSGSSSSSGNAPVRKF